MCLFMLKIWAKSGLFCLFSSFFPYSDKYGTKFTYTSVECVLMIRIRDRWMVAVDESTELWWPPSAYSL